eukprot:c18304_g2_i1 orf=497-1150(+)
MAFTKLLHNHHHHHHHHNQKIFCSRQALPSSSRFAKTLYHAASCRVPLPNDYQLSNHLCSSSDPPSASRPVVILPGLGNNSNDYVELIASLKERGLAATVAEVSRPDWLRNAKGFLDKNCWSGKLAPRPLLNWYFERMNKAITAAKEASGGGQMLSLKVIRRCPCLHTLRGVGWLECTCWSSVLMIFPCCCLLELLTCHLLREFQEWWIKQEACLII